MQNILKCFRKLQLLNLILKIHKKNPKSWRGNEKENYSFTNDRKNLENAKSLTYLFLGDTYLKLKKIEQAKKFYKQALEYLKFEEKIYYQRNPELELDIRYNMSNVLDRKEANIHYKKINEE